MTAFSKNLSQLSSTSLFVKQIVSVLVLCKRNVSPLVQMVHSSGPHSSLLKKNLLSSGPHRYVFLAWQQPKKVQMKAPESRWVFWYFANFRCLRQYGNFSQGRREYFGYGQKTEPWFASRWEFLLSWSQIDHGIAKIVQLNKSPITNDHPRSKGGLTNLNVKISWIPPALTICGVSTDGIDLQIRAPPVIT